MGTTFKATWLRHGDRNTIFFHQKASQRRKRNIIEEIKNDTRRKYEKEVDIARVLTEYFTGNFTSSGPTRVDVVASLVAGRVTKSHLNVLSALVSREEVGATHFSMNPTKEWGIYGFLALFYQRFWYIVGDEIENFLLAGAK